MYSRFYCQNTLAFWTFLMLSVLACQTRSKELPQPKNTIPPIKVIKTNIGLVGLSRTDNKDELVVSYLDRVENDTLSLKQPLEKVREIYFTPDKCLVIGYTSFNTCFFSALKKENRKWTCVLRETLYGGPSQGVMYYNGGEWATIVDHAHLKLIQKRNEMPGGTYPPDYTLHYTDIYLNYGAKTCKRIRSKERINFITSKGKMYPFEVF